MKDFRNNGKVSYNKAKIQYLKYETILLQINKDLLFKKLFKISLDKTIILSYES